jgi:hypothetical protein
VQNTIYYFSFREIGGRVADRSKQRAEERREPPRGGSGSDTVTREKRRNEKGPKSLETNNP